MVAAAFCFTLMVALAKAGSPRFGALEMVFYHGAVSLALLWPWAKIRGLELRTPHLALHGLRSLAGTAGMACWFYSMGALPLGTGITLNYTSSLFTAIAIGVASWWTGKSEQPNRWLHAAIIVGFIGVLTILRPTIKQGSELEMIAGLAGGLLGAIALLLIRRLGQLGEPSWRVVLYVSAMHMLAGALGTSLSPKGWQGIDWSDLPILAGLGITALAGQLCVTRAFARGRTLLAANLQYTGVVFGVLLGWVAFGERPSGLELIGIALIVASGVLATLAAARTSTDARRRPAS